MSGERLGLLCVDGGCASLQARPLEVDSLVNEEEDKWVPDGLLKENTFQKDSRFLGGPPVTGAGSRCEWAGQSGVKASAFVPCPVGGAWALLRPRLLGVLGAAPLVTDLIVSSLASETLAWGPPLGWTRRGGGVGGHQHGAGSGPWGPPILELSFSSLMPSVGGPHLMDGPLPGPSLQSLSGSLRGPRAFSSQRPTVPASSSGCALPGPEGEPCGWAAALPAPTWAWPHPTQAPSAPSAQRGLWP